MPSAHTAGETNTALWWLYFFNGAAQSLPVASLSLILAVNLHGSEHPALVNRFYGGLLLGSGCAKPFIGIFADVIRIGNKRRLPALVVGNFLWAATLLGAAFLCTSIYTYFLSYVVLMIAIGFNETVLDAVSVETMRRQCLTASDIQGAAFFFRSMGSLAASVMSFLIVASTSNITFVVMVSAALPCIGAFVSFLVKEELVESSTSSRNCATICATWDAVTQLLCGKRIQVFLVVMFLFLQDAMPTVDDTWVLYLATLFDEKEYTLLSLVGSFGRVLGLIATRRLKSLSLPKLIVTTALLRAIAGTACRIVLLRSSQDWDFSTTTLKWLYGVGSFVLGAFDTAAFLPLLALCAVVAPPGAEAAGFALMAFAIDVGDQVSAQISAVWVTSLSLGSAKDQNWNNLGMYTVICAASSMIPLCLIPWLKVSHFERFDRVGPTGECNRFEGGLQDVRPVIQISSEALVMHDGS